MAREVPRKEKLTPKQAEFVIEYLKDLNGTQAAIRAGYSEACASQIASENLGKPAILEAIQRQLDARAKRKLITADYVIEAMQEVLERCLQKKPVMVFDKEEKKYVHATEMVEHEDGTVTEEGIYEFDSAGANKAAENLAKHLKLLTDKQEISGPDGSPIMPTTIIFEGVKPKENE